jgi:hypothetical protein
VAKRKGKKETRLPAVHEGHERQVKVYRVTPWIFAPSGQAGYFDHGQTEKVMAPNADLAAAFYPRDAGERYRVMVELYEADPMTNHVRCSFAGWYHVTRRSRQASPCSSCQGTGFWDRAPCSDCGSTGREKLEFEG